MKKLILAAIAVFAFASANAQEDGGFSKGNIFISGDVAIGNTSQGKVSSSNFEFSPKAGYFFTNNIAAGLALGFNSTKNDNGVNTITKSNSFGIGAFGRYYFTPASKFSLFAQLALGMTNLKNTTEVTVGNTTTSTDTKYNAWNLVAAPGMNYFVTKHLSLEAYWGVLGYGSMKQDVAGADAQNKFELGLNMSSINFGLNYKF